MSRVLPYNAKQWEIPAILDGRKTATRRIVKIPYELEIVKIVGESGNINNPLGAMYLGGIKRPPYQPGDILYVRETWAKSTDLFGEFPEYVYRTDYGTTEDDSFPPSMFKWHPSIHMPKEAARIWLKVTDVRVERLQEIKNFREEGIALSESCEECYLVCGGCDPANSPTGCDNEVEIFSNLWDSTLKKSDLDRYGWDANTWVWVIEFERYKRLEGELCKEGN